MEEFPVGIYSLDGMRFLGTVTHIDDALSLIEKDCKLMDGMSGEEWDCKAEEIKIILARQGLIV